MLFEGSVPETKSYRPTQDVLAEERIHNFSLQVRTKKPQFLKSLGRTLICSSDFSERLSRHVLGRRIDCEAGGLGTYVAQGGPFRHESSGEVQINLAQSLNPDSRILLTDDRDEFGQRRLAIDWRLNDTDYRSMRTAAAVLGRYFAEQRIGRLRLREWLLAEDPVPPRVGEDMVAGYHHMCTTRMADDPAHGVVDRDCRIHGTTNLFIGGSSVFGTAGHANPTYTIVQLALRLADHLSARTELSARPVADGAPLQSGGRWSIYHRSHGAVHADLSRLRKGPRRDRGQGRGAADARPQERRDERRGGGRRRSTARPSTLLDELYRNLDPWRKTLVARHPERPHCKDYVDALFREWTPLAGDRNFADDHAVMGGLARFNDRPVVVIGHEKGNDTRSRHRPQLRHGPARGLPQGDPADGSRRPLRLPVITLVDTPGAYPGKGAEERGQAEAIARSTEKCLQIGVPIVSVIIGEGGSGGAVAFATADRIAMLEHSIYSVISPEGCASILWKDAEKMKEAAEALRLTAQDLLALGVIDRIVPEPRGGAQRDKPETIARVGAAIGELLGELDGKKPAELRKARRRKFLDMGRSHWSPEATPRDTRHADPDVRSASTIALRPRISARCKPGHDADGRGPGSKPASRISRSEASSTASSIRAMNSGDREAGRDRRQELDHREPGPPVEAAPAPEHPGVGRRRHAGLAQPLVEHAGADLERRPRARRHPGALRVDRPAAAARSARPACSTIAFIAFDRVAAADRRRADPERVEPEDRRPAQLLLHDELRPRQRLEEHHDVEERLVLGRDQHLALRHRRRAPRPGGRRSTRRQKKATRQ